MTEYKRKPNTICDVCGKKIYRRPCEIARKKRGLFCNQICYGKAQRKEIPCIICGKLILASAHKKTCSRACANKNRAVVSYNTGRRRDKVHTQKQLKIRLLEIRGNQCEQCEFSIYQILHVHHIDRNRTNNDLSNLELLCPNCHAKEHYLKNSKF